MVARRLLKVCFEDTIPPAVVRYRSVTSLRLAFPLAIGSCDSSVRGVEESAGTKADLARASETE